MELYGKPASVCGIGISNLPLIDYLIKKGVSVTARDMKSREKIASIADDLEKKGVKLVLGENYLDGINDDIVFRSPGIRYDKPGLVVAAQNGAFITSEMELFFSLCPARIIGITGSDGKTTTTTLISKILEEDGKKVFLGGNIGRPLLPLVEEMSENDFAVVELSSFQLHTMKSSPSISVITNLSPNHLDYHTDMEEYADAKKNIFLHQKKGNRLVLNAKNAVTYGMRDQAVDGAEVVLFQDESGVCEKDGYICYKNEKILKISEIKIPGHHNVENYMAAISALYGIVSVRSIESVAKNFGGVEHRCELVRELDGVKYYNSSIDSSPTRTAAALNSFTEKLIVICGGYDKNIPFGPLGDTLCLRAKKVILTGATADKIKEAILASENYQTNHPEIIYDPDFRNAIIKARSVASEGDTVILSPACASFDAFPNFEVRGNTFKKIVNDF